MLDVTQVVAWTRMFAGYVATESIGAAAKDTFDPAKPCAICRCVGHAREAGERHGTAVPSAGVEKLVLILERTPAFVAILPARGWPDVPSSHAQIRDGEVPVPPPRTRLA
jgi:hypothetical protein